MLIDIEDTNNLENREKEREVIVGIDFGTTNSILAFYKDKNSENDKKNGNFLNISNLNFVYNSSDKPLFKSVVEIDLGENIVTINSIKRILGKKYSEILSSDSISETIKKYIVDLNDKAFFKFADKIITPEEIASQIFQLLKIKAKEQYDIDVRKAVVTVPAYFDDNAKNMVKHAAKIAGIDVVRLLAEPTSAAYAYGLEKKKQGAFIVYDFGGGTFDVSVLKIQDEVFRVISVGGDNSLGGDDIDFAIMSFLKEKNISIDLDEKTFIDISRKLKEMLSYNEYAALSYEGNDFSLSKSDLYKISEKYIDKTIQIMKKTIKDSDVNHFDGIILVGGSTRLEIVRQKLSENFKIKIFSDCDPDLVVATGAAMKAYNLSNNLGHILIDAVPLSIGIELLGGFVERIIERNSPIPISVSKEYTTSVDGQTSIDFHIVQGDREFAKDCRSLAKFKLKNINPMIAGAAKVKINFSMDSDGIMFVEAFEENSYSSQEIEIKPSFGLSNEDIEKILKDSFDNAEKDFEDRKKAELIFESNELIDKIQKQLVNYKHLLDDNQIKMIEDSCKLLNNLIKSGASYEIKDALGLFKDNSAIFVDKVINYELNNYLKGKSVDEIK